MHNLQQFERHVADEVRISARGSRAAGPARQLDVQLARVTDERQAPGTGGLPLAKSGCLTLFHMWLVQLSARVQHLARPIPTGAARVEAPSSAAESRSA